MDYQKNQHVKEIMRKNHKKNPLLRRQEKVLNMSKVRLSESSVITAPPYFMSW